MQSTIEIKNQSLRVGFDPATGSLSVISENNGPSLLSDAIARADTSKDMRSTSDADYQRTASVCKVTDALGDAEQLVAVCKDGKGQLDFEIRATLYELQNAVVLETICRNASSEPLFVTDIEPLNGACYWPGVSKALTGGKMYYDAGKVNDFDPGASAQGWWSICFSKGDCEPGLIIGYLENKSGLGNLSAKHDSEGTILLVAKSSFEQEFVLQPGATVSSDRLLFSIAENPFLAMEDYAQKIADLHNVRLNPAINGWCSWSYAYGTISEDEMIRQAEFAVKYLKPYGFEYMQVDDGFYRSFGDWEGNGKFPHGMKWLADRIRGIGLKPGIWLAPYCISAGSDVHVNHPDWLIHNIDGTLKACGPDIYEGSELEKQPNPSRFGLDITHPGAAEWLYNLLDTAVNDWGYEFVKTDFVDWTLLSAHRYWDPTVSRAAAYRKGAEIMRKAIGPNCHVLDCGPAPVTVGLVDSTRIELDQPPVNWNQYFLQSASTAPAMAKRYHYHNRTWVNDADHVVMSHLTISQAQAAATLVALSGGNMISGDRLSDLEPNRLGILQKIMPSSGEAYRPVDLFESDRPSIFTVPIKRSFGEWALLGVFNASETECAEKSIALDRLGLDPAKTYVAYDFWKQQFHGEIQGTLAAKVAPYSVMLLAIHEKRGVPQVISTDRHITQGAIELESVEWDESKRVLKGVSIGAKDTSHRVYIYVPESHPVVPEENGFFFHDYPGYTVKLIEPNIVRVQVRFDSAERVEWEFDPKSFFSAKALPSAPP